MSSFFDKFGNVSRVNGFENKLTSFNEALTQIGSLQRSNVQAQIIVKGYEFDWTAFGIIHIKVLELNVALFLLPFDDGRSVCRLKGSYQHVSGIGCQRAWTRRSAVSRVSTSA